MIHTKNFKNGITVHEFRDEKFYDAVVSMKILFELKPFDNTLGALLSFMMGDRYETALSKKDVTKRLDDLYGAKITSHTYTVGRLQVLDVSVRAIRESLADEALYDAQLALLKDIVYGPLINEHTLKEAKANLKQQLDHLHESPAHYALIQAFEHAGKDQKLALNTYGRMEDLDAINVAVMKQFHHKVVHEFMKEIYVSGAIGNGDYRRFEEGVSHPINHALNTTRIGHDTKEVTYAGTQTELVQVYETDVDPLSDLYAAYCVFVAILGQLPSSLLFQNIREKHSLCYSIYASRQNFDGLFYIATGVSDENREKVSPLIAEQFEIIRNGDFEVEPAIHYLQLNLDGYTENTTGLANYTFRNNRLHVDTSLDSMKAALASVTKEQVIEVLDHIHEPFTFAYRGIQK